MEAKIILTETELKQIIKSAYSCGWSDNDSIVDKDVDDYAKKICDNLQGLRI